MEIEANVGFAYPPKHLPKLVGLGWSSFRCSCAEEARSVGYENENVVGYPRNGIKYLSPKESVFAG